MMDRIIIWIARREVHVAVLLTAIGGWWAERAIGRGLRALTRREEKSEQKSGGRA